MLQKVLLIFAAATTTTFGVRILRGSHEDRRLQLWVQNLWPQSTICYDPIGSEFTAEQKDKIMAGFTEFEEKTNLRFLDINKCTDQSLCGGCKVSVRFFQGGGCGSAMGFDGGYPQTISLDDGCFNRGTILHEIGHTAGLLHEHQHNKRDMVLLLGNIPSDVPAHNVAKELGREDHSTKYDRNSVMHYETGEWMCVPKADRDPNDFCDYGQTSSTHNCKVATEEDCDLEAGKGIGSHDAGLSDGDVEALLIMYPETSPTTDVSPRE